jgi:hypothetical protein
MLHWVVSVLFVAVLGRAINEEQQHPLVPEIPSGLGRVPGHSIVRLCPESRDTDALAIENIANRPYVPYLYILNSDLTFFVRLISDRNV